ncbi:apoptosis antagonizing transcription factor-domain-containing protein [Flammula alnicola]|nr:apoptosis antagonizing transcription factor-domain-containing protein [Flammula alnicola]
MPTDRLSLAEQIAQLEEAAPVDYDPEDLQSRGGDDGMHLDTGATREHYFEVGPSSIRNRFPSVADAKYEGVRISRKQLLEDTDDDLSDENNEEDPEDFGNVEGEEEDMDSQTRPTETPYREGSEQLSNGRAPSDSEEGGDGSEDDEDVPEKQPSNKLQEGHTEDVTSSLKKTREDDMKKGQAVKKQIALWDTILGTRIQLQKCPSQMKEYLEISDCRDAISKCLNEAFMLTDELSQLQETLLSTNDVIQPPPRKRRKLDTETSIEGYSEAFISATEDIAALEQAFHPYLLQTLSKWSSKIQAVAPSILLPSNRGTFLKGGQSLKSVVQLIDETLDDRDKLLTRTQVARVKKARIGMSQEENVDTEDTRDSDVFDDTDFYQKMLRDIIDARGNGSKSEDWMLLQSRRRRRRKSIQRPVKAGNFGSYEVHEKLQNFMVPVPVPGAWHEEQVDELFASLLGRGFENIGINAEEPQVQRDIEVGGFRVFG